MLWQQKSISVYTKAFLLSPTVSAYKGNASEHVLVSTVVSISQHSLRLSQKAMQSLNVSGLPAENEVVRVKELLSAIGSALTTFRNTMKTKVSNVTPTPASLFPSSHHFASQIALSIQDGNKLRNIADLAHDLIRNTSVTAMLQLYIRLAFLVSYFIDPLWFLLYSWIF